MGNGGTSGISGISVSSTGRVGLGITSPGARLHSQANSGNLSDLDNDYVFEDFRNGNDVTQYMVQRAANGTPTAPAALGDGTTTGINIGGYMFAPRTSSGYPGFGYGETGMEGFYRGDGTTTLTELRWKTSSSTRMALDATGQLGIGTTSPSATLHVAGNSSTVRLQGLSGTGSRVVTADASGNLSATATLPTGESTTASNGLTRTGVNVALGGTLTQATTIAQAGNNLSLTGTGNLGLGTSSPLAKLDILGGNDANATLNVGAMAFQYSGNASGGYRHFLRTRHNSQTAGSFGYGNAMDFYLNNTGTPGGSSAPGTGNLHVLTLENNIGTPRVGIATTAPTATLHVAGSTSSVLLEGLAGTGSRVVTADASGTLSATAALPTGESTAADNGLTLNGTSVQLGGTLSQSTSIATGPNDFSITGAGNVGIGTSSPAAKLHVAGTAGASNVRLESLGGTGTRYVVTDASGNLSTSTGPTGGESTTASNGLSLSGTSVKLGGTLTGATTIAKANNFLALTGGGVGIGATSASDAARATIQTASASETGLFVGLTGASTANSMKLEHNGSNFIVRPVSAGGTSTVIENSASGALVINPSGGNVGIGTTAPTAKLHVAGTAAIDAANTLEFGAGVSGKDVNAGKIGYQTFTTGALDVVGAGTTNANRKIKLWAEGGLEVAGGTKISGLATGGTAQMVTASSNGTLATAAIPSGESTTAANGLTLNGTAAELGGTLNRATTIATGGNNLTVTGTGNVGIGVAAPTTKLEVSGVLGLNSGDGDKIYLTSALANGSKIAHSTGWVVDHYAGPGDVSTGNRGAFRFFTTPAAGGYAERMQLSAAGQLGIGTSPSALLDVNGSTRLRGLAGTGTRYVVADASGNLSATTSPAGGESTTAGNGLTLNGTAVELGGTLSQATTIATGSFGLGLSSSTSAVLGLSSSSTTGTWLSLSNSAGGAQWNLISTGSANGEGAGKLLVRDSNNGTVRATFDTNGRLGIGTSSPTAMLHVAGSAAIDGSNTLEFGTGVSGKEVNAGKIGYQTFTAGTLDIVGAGTTNANRKIKLWAEGGLDVAGPVRVRSLTATGTQMVTADANGNLGVATLPTDAQQLSISGTTLSLTNGSSVTLPTGSADNLGNHTATQNLNLATFKLKGNGSTDGLSIGSNGRLQTDGYNLSLGYEAGSALATNTVGTGGPVVGNVMLGMYAGNVTTGGFNTLVGSLSGQQVSTGTQNTFLGANSGFQTLTGSGNTLVGTSAGFSNQGGSNNTALGNLTNIGTALTNATAIGYGASATASNSLVLGSGANVGIGVSAPTSTLHVSGSEAGAYTDTGTNTSFALGSSHRTVRRLSTCTTITVPDASTCAGRLYTIINYSGQSAFTLTVTSGGSVFDGTTNTTFSGTNAFPTATRLTIQSDGAGWIVVSR